MSPMMNYSRFNKEGKYSSSEGTDELQADHGVELSMDPAYKGIEDFEEGDEVDLKIKARIGAQGEGGKRSMEVILCEIEPMQGDAKKFRNEKRSNMPPESTLMDDEG